MSLEVINIYDIKIGDEITVEKGLELAQYFDLPHIVKRLQEHPERYKSFEFDGVSCFPDSLLNILTGISQDKITYEAALKHDIFYAYGENENEVEKKTADTTFFHDLIRLGVPKWQAHLFLKFVEIGGIAKFHLSFSWGFARKDA